MTQQRLVTSLLIVMGAVLVLIIVQNPAQTTLDVLSWTITIRQGLSLVLAFGCGVLVGWGGHLVYRRLHGVKTHGGLAPGPLPASHDTQTSRTS